MAISVDPQTFVITIPQSDLTNISGTIYELDTDWFRLALKAWEAEGDGTFGGITFLKTHLHNTTVTVAGVTYARTIQILPPYSVEFEDGQYTVILTGSNNNIFDVLNGILVQNQVQVVPTNAAGLIQVTSGSGVTEQDKLDIADRVWDETLTAATHNIPTSAGRRLRDTSSSVIHTGTAVSATVNSIVLNGDASGVDGAYDPASIAIINGTGFGQTRNVFQYDGSTKRAWVDRNWKVTPDATSEYAIVADAGREHINEGVAQGGGSDTITLNSLASPIDDVYTGQIIFIRSGTGEDQALRVIAYNGTTKVATLCDPWDIVPDSTSVYVMLPTSVLKSDKLANAIWDEPLTGASHNVPTSAGRRLRELGNAISSTVNDLSATTTSFVTTLTETRDDFYIDQIVRFESGNLEGHVRPILAYDGTSKTITVSEPMVEAPDDGIDFVIIPTHVHPMEEISNAVWEEDLTTHNTDDTAGKIVQDTKRDVGDAQALILAI